MGHHNHDAFKALNIAVLTLSDTRTEENDTSGQLLVERLQTAGHHLADKKIVTDDVYKIRAVMSQWIADESVEVVISTGGTGVTGRDLAPEAIELLFDRTIDGFGEMFRHYSFDEIGVSTVQSRAFAGTANGTYIFCLPGSSGACKTGWDKILKSQLDITTKPCNFAVLIPRLLET
ncbi:MAG: molybdenum cofactor biosynthesis protein B [Methylococcales bacterium]|jgi:molybdopterin adenylyltransferase|nr:molybdenum cofactor biosynthesis protein B [Methylococcales bacterium]MBT7445363.1 molybdenum cofactor biosynthesis protein B [Methylococcales bacterium]